MTSSYHIIAETLDRLLHQNNPKTNRLSKTAQVQEVKYSKRNPRLYTFLVKGSQSYSSKTGHIVNILFTDNTIRKNGQLLNKNMKCSCTCPAFQYQGCAFNATMGRYNLSNPENTPPDTRDPMRKNKICKHVAATTPIIQKLKIESAEPIRWNNTEVLVSIIEDLGIPISSEKEFSELMEKLIQ